MNKVFGFPGQTVVASKNLKHNSGDLKRPVGILKKALRLRHGHTADFKMATHSLIGRGGRGSAGSWNSTVGESSVCVSVVFVVVVESMSLSDSASSLLESPT